MTRMRRRPMRAAWQAVLALIAGALVLTSSAGAGRASGQVGAATQSSALAPVAMANTVLERTRFNIPAVFGPSSPEGQEERDAAGIPCGFGSNPPCTAEQQKAKNRPQTDFVGIAIHCGKSDRACSAAVGARPDALPDEPGGYVGLSGLFGARYADPFI